jgi:2-oxoisovalerate dehydrogenase E1 component
VCSSDLDYILPLGKANILLKATDDLIKKGNSLCIITYGMGVYWSKTAAKEFNDQVEIIDLRTLYPLDEKLIYERVKVHGKCIVISEEPSNNSFAQSLASKISQNCFNYLDMAVKVIGSENLPAIPLNSILEERMLPNAKKIEIEIQKLFDL